MLLCKTVFGLLPKLNCEKKKNLYCNIEIVLQETGQKKRNCIAIQKFVLQ